MSLDHCRRFLLLYGSQTGQSQAIAEEIAEVAGNKGYNGDLHCFSETEKKFCLERETCVVIVISSTGQGDPPDTVKKFWRRIKKKSLLEDHLELVNFALLGLGDTNYNSFGQFPRDMEKRLKNLGAKPFYPSVIADDAVGLEVAVDPWIQELWPALDIFFRNRTQLDDASTDALPTRASDETRENDSVTDAVVKINSDIKSPSAELLNGVDRMVNGEAGDGPDISEHDVSTDFNDATIKDENSDNNCDEINEFDSINDKNPENLIMDGIDESVTKIMNGVGEILINDNENFLAFAEPLIGQPATPLLGQCLTTPKTLPAYLGIEYAEDDEIDVGELPYQNGCKFPFSASRVFLAPLIAGRQLTRPGAVKTTLELQLDLTGCPFSCKPGDAFSVVCENEEQEVDTLLARLGVRELADVKYTLRVLPDTKKKKVPTATLR